MPRNAHLFIWFRVFFNARFYYPVLTVMFVDLGLTMDQYSLLNVAWALSIVTFELPLGALGDQIGRKKLIVGAAALMVVEMAVLAFAPTSNPTLLFVVFLINRVLSGIAEAAASGADEALAYDSMVEAGQREQWPKVLSRLARRMSVAFVLAMVVGAAVYDASLMRSAAAFLGLDVAWTQETTARFPVYLTLVLSLAALATALRMEEPPSEKKECVSLADNCRGILAAAAWIGRNRFALALVLFSLVLDTAVRLFLTFTSAYYRLLDVPARWFGVLGAAFAGIGMLVPPLAERLLQRKTPFVNFAFVFACMLGGLFLAAASRSWWGILCIVPLAVGMQLLGFFGSDYMNGIADSERRATVLSFRSLANNLTYGFAGWSFAVLMQRLADGERPPAGSDMEEAVFAQALGWIPAGLALMGLTLLTWAQRVPRMRSGQR